MLTKVTAPKLKKNLLIRKRLFKRLDKADNESAIWLAGPAGSGKTSLIASYLSEKRIPASWYQIDPGDNDISNFFYYLNQAAAPLLNPKNPPLPLLTPEYSTGVDTFVATYFERLFQRLQPPRWLVLDNFQEIQNNSSLAQRLASIIASIPSEFKLVVISRHNPWPSMARLRANQVLKMIGGRDLALSIDECRRLKRVLDCDWSEKAIAEVHRLTKGWMAGLILLSLHSSFNPESQNRLAEIQPTSVFDYFAAEVFKNCDSLTQQFLCQTAVLPHMTAETAQRLTSMDAKAIIARLQHRNFFLEQRQAEPPGYQYHPLFRDFLIQMASRLIGPDALKEIMNRGAEIMAEQGLGREAVSLYHKAENFQSMAEYILSQAPVLVAQGRTNTLNRWIDGFPDDRMHAYPWLLFWKGVCLAHIHPVEGKALFIQAYEAFVAGEDLLGRVFSWSALIQVFLMARDTFEDLDRWIGEGQHLETLIPENMGPDILGRFYASFLFSLSLRNLGHPEFFRIQQRCEHLLTLCTDNQVLDALGSYLSMSYVWMGQTNRMGILLKLSKPLMMHPDAPPVAKVNFLAVSSFYSIMVGDWDSARQAIEQYFALSEKSGIRVYDFNVHGWASYKGVLTGDARLLQEHLEGMERLLSPSAVWDSGQYHYTMALAALLTKDFSLCRFHLDECRKIADYAGTPNPMGLSRVLEATFFIVQNDFKKAIEAIDCISRINVSQHTGHVFFLKELVLADCALAQNRKAEMIAHLKAALSDAAQNGIMMPLGLSRERLANLLSEAIGADIETDTATAMIHRFQLVPSPADLIGEKWPWPIKLVTLGRFDIFLDDERLAISGKTPKKPLELLKLLVCKNGGSIDREAVMDRLWPEADGDRAVQNINTTLHRLRKLLGRDDSIVLKHGRLSLNPELCWVDAWHFEAMFDKAKSDRDLESRIDMLSRAIDLYAGPFSGEHDDSESGIWYAQRLRNAWMDAVLTTGQWYMENNRIERSKDLFQRSLAIDDTVEPFYRELMALLYDQGRLAEAKLVSNRCRHVLSKRGLLPADDTMALFNKLQTERSKSNPKK
ncbi:BTAD domain-containing putative transcriptional regulator [uncultured Desulfosarcina sp.]|uniref:BTAD domain-containing putative transcriptional regulator n=1 Tax=uncultured Desulfosarcina sp. TaxID=218289 RepID=UPI0029C87481|nr:BTAD domain-containing putative transcriptional regulator [uncultured Desulfosarcina sp.]